LIASEHGIPQSASLSPSGPEKRAIKEVSYPCTVGATSSVCVGVSAWSHPQGEQSIHLPEVVFAKHSPAPCVTAASYATSSPHRLNQLMSEPFEVHYLAFAPLNATPSPCPHVHGDRCKSSSTTGSGSLNDGRVDAEGLLPCRLSSQKEPYCFFFLFLQQSTVNANGRAADEIDVFVLNSSRRRSSSRRTLPRRPEPSAFILLRSSPLDTTCGTQRAFLLSTYIRQWMSSTTTIASCS